MQISDKEEKQGLSNHLHKVTHINTQEKEQRNKIARCFQFPKCTATLAPSNWKQRTITYET